MISDEVIKKEMKIAEEIFGTSNDPEQIPINMDSLAKLKSLSPEAIQTKLNEEGEPISWVIVVPTSKLAAEKFLKKEINERQLFEEAQSADVYEALYLCSAITLPKYRNKGYATNLFKEAIEKIPHVKDVLLFAWPTSTEGRQLADTGSKRFGHKIQIRE